MKRIVLLVIASLVVLAGCGGPQTTQGPRLSGMYSGPVYASGYAIGGMAIDVTTSGGRLSGQGCFVALDSSYACNTLSGSLSGNEATFRIGGLVFSGTTNGYYIDTSFRADDGSVSGTVYFTEADTSAADAASALPISAAAESVGAEFATAFGGVTQPLH